MIVAVLDLNCDLGESYGAYVHGADDEMMPMITSANIACGAHGGEPAVMRRSVDRAIDHGVAIGAHVGLPDRLGFGRREIPTSGQEVYDLCLYQIGALDSFVRVRGRVLQHVKLHGALYMMANRDRVLAEAACAAIAALSPSLLVYVLPGSHLHSEAMAAGLTTVAEIFADRPYRDGHVQMYDRSPGLVGGPDQVVARSLRELDRAHGSGGLSLCVHSDTPGAPALLRAIRAALLRAGYSFQSPTPSTPVPTHSTASPTRKGSMQ